METVIEKLTTKNFAGLSKSDSEFVIDSKIVPHYENGKLTWHVPADIHEKVIGKLEADLKRRYGDLAVVEETSTQVQLGIILPGLK